MSQKEEGPSCLSMGPHKNEDHRAINTIKGHYALFRIFLAGIFWGSQKEARGSRLEAPTRRLAE